MKNKNLLGWIIFLAIVIGVIIALNSCTPTKYGCPDPNPKKGEKMRDGYNHKRMQRGIF